MIGWWFAEVRQKKQVYIYCVYIYIYRLGSQEMAVSQVRQELLTRGFTEGARGDPGKANTPARDPHGTWHGPGWKAIFLYNPVAFDVPCEFDPRSVNAMKRNGMI